MMLRILLLILFLLASASESFAETPGLIWADKVLGVSSEYISPRDSSGRQYRAFQALGKPNVMPAVKNSPCAWSPRQSESRGEEWIKVGFNTPKRIRQVVIAESFNAGAVSHVYVFDSRGLSHMIYKNLDTKPVSPRGRMLHIFTDDLTDYEVVAVRVVLNTIDVPGYNHIDAVGLSSSATPVKAKINLASDIPFSRVRPLSSLINSPFHEVLPVVSPDGKTLYFDRKQHPENFPSPDGGPPRDDIWVSRRAGEKWILPRRMPAPLNNRDHNYVCSVTPDGNTLLLGNAYSKKGELFAGASLTQRTASGWSFPEPLVISEYQNYNDYAEFALGPNGKVLLLAIQSEESYGSRDIYVSFKRGRNLWSKPLNLGKRINTADVELTPFLASDGKTLYFASGGHSGYGGCDMFVSRRLDDTWTNWSEPMNLGPILNSSDWDMSFTLDASGEDAYFVSYKNAKNSDIYTAQLPEETRPEAVILISGTVFNSKTKEPLGAHISYEDLGTGEEAGIAVSDPKTGKYKIALPVSKAYGFLAGIKGFLSVHENIDLSDSSAYAEIRRDLYLTPIEVGQSVRLNNVFFERGRSELLSGSFTELDRIVSIMKENPGIEIELSGHTDIEGSSVLNMKLSALRVNSIKRYIVSKGIPEERVETKALGGTQPITEERDEESKMRNRRVEFKILKN